MLLLGVNTRGMSMMQIQHDCNEIQPSNSKRATPNQKNLNCNVQYGSLNSFFTRKASNQMSCSIDLKKKKNKKKCLVLPANERSNLRFEAHGYLMGNKLLYKVSDISQHWLVQTILYQVLSYPSWYGAYNISLTPMHISKKLTS